MADQLFDLKPGRAIVLAPHADDEVLGAGGLMAKLAEAGWQVEVLFATISGYLSAPRQEDSSTEARGQEARAALEVLGAAGHRAAFVGEEFHLRLDTVAQSELVSFVETAVAELSPSLVVLPCLGHYHQDHRACATAAIAALRPAPGGRLPFVPAVLAYGHGAAGWGGRSYEFHPSVFVDITAQIERKIQALACYASQVCAPPHLRSLEAVRRQAAVWGAFSGTAYAEAFECLRLVAR